MTGMRQQIGFLLRVLTTALLILLCISCEDLLSVLGDPRSKLIDDWKVDENTTAYKSGEEIYWVAITEHPTDSTMVLISNFYNIDENAMAEAVLSGRTLTLPGQALPGGFTVSGSGAIQSDWNTINWSYSVDDGSGIQESFSAVYTRLE